MLKIFNKKGQSAVEFALLLPILLLLILGVFELSRVLNAGLVINHASREAARYAALGGSDLEVLTVVTDQSNNLDTSNMTVTITPAQTSRDSGENVTIKIDYKIEFITPFIGSILGDDFVISGDTTMRVE